MTFLMSRKKDFQALRGWKYIRRGIEEVITGLTRKRLGFVPRYCVKALVFSQMLRFPAVFATLACRKAADHLSVFYQSSQQNHIRRGIEEVITGLTRNQFAWKRTWVRIPSSPPLRGWNHTISAPFWYKSHWFLTFFLHLRIHELF